MIRRHTILTTLITLALAGTAFARTRTTTSSTFTARRSFQLQLKREIGRMMTGPSVHAHRIHWLAYTKGADWNFGNTKDPKLDYDKVMVWRGPERGPGDLRKKGPYDVRIALVPRDKTLTPAQMVQRTKLSGDLMQRGLTKVTKHLRSQGKAVKSVKFGDYVKPLRESWKPSGKRLSQKPISRASGYLRYTVVFADGTRGRYLVKTNAGNMIRGGNILGKVFADTDLYR